MTLAEAQEIFTHRPGMSDPRTKQAAAVLGQITEVKRLIVRQAAGKQVKKPTPGHRLRGEARYVSGGRRRGRVQRVGGGVMATQREASKAEWGALGNSTGVSQESINGGSLQRIADACEQIAGQWTALLAERDKLKRDLEELRKAKTAAEQWRDEERWKLERKVIALRGVITRMKRQTTRKAGA